MTAFAMPTLPSLDDPADLLRLPRPIRAAAVDSIINETRKKTPSSVVEQRATPRYSIAELNRASWDQVEDRFRKYDIDERGPVARFLDLVDLPRNVLANVLAPSLASRKRAAGEKGAFGLGVVRTADILESLGVENRIVRGLVGFAGDVALDPLTYLGPAGWGAKAVGTAGAGRAAVRFTGPALRTIKQSAKAGSASADEFGRYFRAFDAYAKAKPDDAAKYGLDLSTEMGRRASILGGHKKATTFGGKAKAGVGRFLGGDITGESSPLADFLHRSIVKGQTDPIEQELIEASKALVGKWGQSAAPGIRFGREGGKLGVEAAGRGPGRFAAGSTIAHIPFTDWGIHVPAFTADARAGIVAAQLAANPYATGRIPGEATTGTRANIIRENLAESEKWLDEERAAMRENESLTERLNEMAELGLSDPLAEVSLRRRFAENTARIGEASGRMRASFEATRARALELSADPFADIGEIGYAGQALEQANARFRAAQAEAEAFAKATADRRFAPKVKPLEERIGDAVAQGGTPAAESAHAAYFDDIDRYNKTIAELSEADIAARASFADSLADYAKAREMYAGNIQGALANTMLDRQLRDAAGAMIGLSPDYSGYTTFSSIGGVLDAMQAETKNAALQDIVKAAKFGTTKASHILHKLFGIKDSSDASRILRALLRSAANPNEGVAFRSVVDPFMDALAKIAKDHGVERDQVADIFGLLRASGQQLIEGSPEVVVLDKAVKAGMFDPRTKPGFFDDIKRLSDSMTPEMEYLLREAQDIGAMGAGMDTGRYWPGALSQAGAKEASSRRADIFRSAKKAPPSSSLAEDFSRRKGLIEHTFEHEGKTYRFMEGDRWVVDDLSANDLKNLSPDEQASIGAKRAVIELYDSLGKPGASRPISAMEANQIAAEGGFQLLLGGPMENAFANPAIALGLRFHQQEKARLSADLKHILNSVAMPVDKSRLSQIVMHPDGADFTLANGAKGRLFRFKRAEGDVERMAVQVGNEIYRRPDIATPTESGWNPFGSLYGGDKIVEAWLPDRLATELERIAGAFKTESQARELLDALDKITTMWKGITLLHPSWTINDMVSTVVLAAAAGISPATIVRHFKQAVQIVSRWKNGDVKALEEMRLLDGYTGMDMIHPGPVQGGGMHAGTIGEALADGTITMPPQRPLMDRRMLSDPNYRRSALDEIKSRVRLRAAAEQKQSMLRNVPGMEKLRAAKGIVLDEVLQERVFKPWYQMNAFANDVIRTAAYIGALEQGRSVEDAARYIGENLLDMHLYTQADRNIKRFVPFYSWMKASGAFGVRQLMENPKFFTMAPHLKRAVEEAVNGEGRLPEHQRPSWLREQLAIQLGSEDSSRRFLLAGQITPSEAATYFATMLGSPVLGWEALQDALGYFANSMTPVARVPLELGQGRELFTQRTIGKYGDLTPGEYMLGQLRPLRELGLTGGPRKGGIEKALERGPVDAAARLLVGGKLQPGQQGFLDSQIMRESDEIEKNLRRRIAIAEREGRDSSADRARLLRLYERRQQQGLGEEVPKWAQGQLASLVQ